MGWRSFLGLDMTGQLSKWKRRYKSDWRRFDHRIIWCGVTRWYGGKCTVSASAYCNDSNVSGIDSRPIVSIYTSPGFYSLSEAEAHLEEEIRRATRKYPQTRFYRDRNFAVIENGRVAEKPVTVQEYCLAGQWHHSEHVPFYRRCEACGHETEEAICAKCGEPVFS